MKQIILSLGLAFLSTISFSQELRMNQVDEFTGKTIKVTKSYSVGKVGSGKLFMSFRRVDDSYGVEFWSTTDQGCSGANDNYVIFLSDDGTTISLNKDLADIDCSDMASSVYMIDLADFENLNVSKIRFAQSDGYIDFVFESEYTVQDHLNAIK